MSTIRKQIIDALIARLSEILKTNTYLTDAGAKVFFNETAEIGTGQMPCISVEDSPDGVTQGMGISERVLSLTVAGKDHGKTKDAVLEAIDKIGADIEKAIGRDDTFGGLALTTNIKGPNFTLKKGEDILGEVPYDLIIEYQTLRWDPLTKGY